LQPGHGKAGEREAEEREKGKEERGKRKGKPAPLLVSFLCTHPFQAHAGAPGFAMERQG
jgi:hypothetical protein